MEVGIGHSSPVLSGNRIFQFTRTGEQETAAAYDVASGKLLWKESYDLPYSMNPAATRHGKGPKSTPVVVGGRLYTFGINGTLSCYDAAGGKVVWRNDFTKDFPTTAADFGTAMSPIIEGGAVIVHAGGPGKGAIVALDAATGKEKWRWAGDEPAYASPIAIEIGGTRQIITQTRQNIVGIAAAGGELLWKVPFTTEYEQNIITPVVYKDMLIFSGLGNGAFALRVEKKGESWTPTTVWRNEKASMYMSSPVVVGDYLYGMTYTRKGQYFCLDARTGAQQWISEGAEGENASIVSVGKDLFLLNDIGDLTVARTSEKSFDVLRKYTVAKSPTWAHFAIHSSHLFIKDQNTLSAWSLK